MSRSTFQPNWMLLLLAVIIAVLIMTPGDGRANSQTTSAPIYLQYAVFDPLEGEPTIPAEQRQAIQLEQPATYILQFTGPVLDEWKTAVAQMGVQLYGYIPDNAFIARMDAETAGVIETFTFVRWVGLYHPAYRLDQSLADLSASLENEAPSAITVETLPDVDLQSLAAQIEALGGTVEGTAANEFSGYVAVQIAPRQLAALANLDGVIWIESDLPAEIANDAGGGVMNADSIRSTLHLYGGTGGVGGGAQIVGVSDTGLDTGSLGSLHPDLLGRVVNTYCVGRPSPCDWSDFNGHGTHVAGSVLGNGTASGSNPSAHQYAGAYAGLAPEAEVVFQSLYNQWGQLIFPTDIGQLFQDAYTDGARIHTNSWGGPCGTPQAIAYGCYHTRSQQADQAMWNHKDMLVLFAAGNEGEDTDKNGVIDADSVGWPGTAKNVLTVGASENNRPGISAQWGSSYGNPITSDPEANNPAGLAAFSSRGPTDDGRIKPDVVAPGTFIASLRTRQYLFNDTMEGDTSGYIVGALGGGTGATPWQLITDQPHSGTHYWKETVSGTFTQGAMSALFTAPMNIWPSGGHFDVQFWHKFSLSANDHLAVLVMDPATGAYTGILLNASGVQNSYSLVQITLSATGFQTPPEQVRLGFAIQSGGVSNSQWWVDDVRVDGSDWGTLSNWGLVQPGSAEDDAYVFMGGTSMATPLTAGAAALAREWLTTMRGFANPSAALMKAVMINGALDISPGQYGTGATREIPAQRPNNVAGWGRVDLVGSLNPASPRQIWLEDNTAGLSTGGSATYQLTIGPAQAQGSYTLPQANLPAKALFAPAQPAAAASPTVTPLPSGPVKLTTGGGQIALGSGDLPAASFPFTQLLQNPGFESGAWSPWQIYGAPYLTNIIFHSGSWSAHLGNANNADDEFSQTAAIPAGASGVTIDFWYRFRTDETYEGYDFFCYGIWDESGALAYVHRCGDFALLGDLEWTEEIYTLTPAELADVAGQTVLFGFYVTTDSSQSSRAWVDDTLLDVVSAGATPTNTPTATQFTATPTRTPTSTATQSGAPTRTPTPTSTSQPGGSPTPTRTATQPTQTGGMLRFSLVWVDYPGQPAAAKALVNDLDLEVIAPDGTHYYGNAGLYTSGQCLRSGQWDACNNVEGVTIPNAVYGTYTVIVHGYNVPNGPQPFAVAASGDYLREGGGAPGGDYTVYLPVVRR